VESVPKALLSHIFSSSQINFNAEDGTVVFANGDWSVIWVFLLAYSIAIITYCFMWSVFFSKGERTIERFSLKI
jgi:hypothetical protein